MTPEETLRRSEESAYESPPAVELRGQVVELRNALRAAIGERDAALDLLAAVRPHISTWNVGSWAVGKLVDQVDEVLRARLHPDT
jgi:hypothetical protein